MKLSTGLLLAHATLSCAWTTWKPAKSGRSNAARLDAVSSDELADSPRAATKRKKWGVDNQYTDEYWFNPTIHTLGNHGLSGALHAAIAPLSTKLIDVLAYKGKDIRAEVAEKLALTIKTSKARVVDLCCGVGISTRSLQKAFPDAETVIGVDTSPEMVEMACFLSKHLAVVQPMFQDAVKRLSTTYTVMKEQRSKMQKATDSVCSAAVQFVKGNAEHTDLPDKSFDLVTIMYAFHEAPKAGRDRILKEARRLLRPGGALAVIDISPNYTPSETMLKGEPYVLEYQKNIHDQLQSLKGFKQFHYENLVPGHVDMWLLKRASSVTA